MRYVLICLFLIACSDPVTPDAQVLQGEYMGQGPGSFMIHITSERVKIDLLDSDGERSGPGWRISDVIVSNGKVKAWAEDPFRRGGTLHYEGALNPPVIEGVYWMAGESRRLPLNLRRIK